MTRPKRRSTRSVEGGGWVAGGAPLAPACTESDVDLQQKIEHTLDRPDAAGTATLYATTTASANNRLVKVVDSSTNGTTGTPSSYTSLAAAGSNYVFRGVELRPF